MTRHEVLEKHKRETAAKEQRIISLILMGYNNVDIAREMGIELTTVKHRLNVLYKRLGISGMRPKRVELAKLCLIG